MKSFFVNADQACDMIVEKDDYLSNFSQFDIQSRLGTPDNASFEELIDHLYHQCLDWDLNDIKRINQIFKDLSLAYSNYMDYLPEEIPLIMTTGRDEMDAAYTRCNRIFIPRSMVQWSTLQLKELIGHELFHIVSRNNLEFKNNWYRKLNFTTCPELEIPLEYKDLVVTNPDTVNKNAFTEISYNGKDIKVIPFLYSKGPYQGGYFFNYMKFSYMII